MKRKKKAQETANQIIARFERGDIAEPLARIFIAGGNLPMRKWSFMNQFACLISGCTDARGFRQWQEAGRTIKKGEKAAAYILIPLTRKRKLVDENGDESYQWMTYGFKGLPVFDVTQTEGEPLPHDEKEEALLESLPLTAVAQTFGLELLTYGGKEVGADGFYAPSAGKIGLGVENVATWLHELIHAADDRLGNLTERGQHWRSETVAQLGASVLAHMIGLGDEADEGGSWQYISGYANKEGIEPIKACQMVIDRTCQAINHILETAAQLA